MKKIFLFSAFMLLLLPGRLYAQLEKVIVENYYISDANDATDTIGGYLAPGSKTYRIYIDLVKGSVLKKMYGDTNHVLRFTSTDYFFNNKSDGESFGKDFAKNRLLENTVALDTWITLGQTTRTSTKTNFGVLKIDDNDGSFIGGSNNDGGSATIASGLLNNADPLAGIPLTINDGMDTLISLPSSWGDYGINDLVTQTDSTIFGSVIPGMEFKSTIQGAGIFNSGVMGVVPDSNQILVAQLTTLGDISFELNIEIADSAGTIIRYVANDSILNNNEILSRYLKYPYEPVCGCPDPNYLEYLDNRDCDNFNLCSTLIVFGCLDTNACNYNPDANYNLPNLCCYPGFCNDRDISVVCPESLANRSGLKFNFFPNPAGDLLNLEINSSAQSVLVSIYNSYGNKVSLETIKTNTTDIKTVIDISNLEKGLYIIYLSADGFVQTAQFMKY
jgi:Secretion system C-terminal sorting domain